MRVESWTKSWSGKDGIETGPKDLQAFAFRSKAKHRTQVRMEGKRFIQVPIAGENGGLSSPSPSQHLGADRGYYGWVVEKGGLRDSSDLQFHIPTLRWF